MTNATPAQPDRLDRIEAILAETARQQQINTAALAETRALVESNAKAIEANSQSISTLRSDIRTGFAETRAEIRGNVDDLVSMIGSLAIEREQTEAIVRETSQQVQNLIDDGKADRAEAQRQREANAKDHAAFQENFQSLLLSFNQEIQKIWQRLSA